MLSNNINFNTSDSFLKKANNNLHFDKFIITCQAISHKSFLNKTINMSNLKNLYLNNNCNEFSIEYILKQ